MTEVHLGGPASPSPLAGETEWLSDAAFVRTISTVQGHFSEQAQIDAFEKICMKFVAQRSGTTPTRLVENTFDELFEQKEERIRSWHGLAVRTRVVSDDSLCVSIDVSREDGLPFLKEGLALPFLSDLVENEAVSTRLFFRNAQFPRDRGNMYYQSVRPVVRACMLEFKNALHQCGGSRRNPSGTLPDS